MGTRENGPIGRAKKAEPANAADGSRALALQAADFGGNLHGYHDGDDGEQSPAEQVVNVLVERQEKSIHRAASFRFSGRFGGGNSRR